ncbi:hypothetical protein DXG03_007007 [Asterophora parasitica]|uniref:Uncharacterized protein n=1 Tax=Asterophora parasitica TaxID=117018 RepID=A0A9P7GG27_9AGAR|nr:hypothetical protein DXG03_007007 [Asterophora parasitica]
MQSQSQSYPNYPYYGQPIYQQPHAQYMGPGPSNGYPQYPYPANNLYVPPAAPQERIEPFIPPNPTAAAPRGKSHRRTATTPAGPLKSALKKSSAVAAPAATEALTRQPTYPGSGFPNPQISRPRLLSNNFRGFHSDLNHEEFRPLHMFMLLIGNNELRLENIMDPALRELRSTILPLWPEGVESDSQHGHDWTVRFRSNPWTLQGPHVATALHIIVELWTLFARRGFAFQTSMNIGSPTPRLVFEVKSHDPISQFFLAYFSHGGRRLHLIKPPTVVDDTLGSQLKAYLPRRITEESVSRDVRIIEVKKQSGPGVTEVEPQFFLMHVLKCLYGLGYTLQASVPLGRRGPLGLRAGKEMLVFRGTVPDSKA